VKYQTIISLFFVVLLSACTLNPQQTSYSVDHHDLVRSAVYTQRELINIQLAQAASQGSEQRPQRQTLLLLSYCDLIDRRTIHASVLPEARANKNSASRHCTSQFHRCFKSCELRSSDCRRCEQSAIDCIKLSES
jgi:hypothetical protein